MFPSVRNIHNFTWLSASFETIISSLRSTYLNCFSLHMNWINPSSSGSLHFNSTVEQSTTSGFKNKPRASL